jgi:myosin-5
MLEATEDLTNLSYLNEPAVLNSIRTRYQSRGQIYVSGYMQPLQRDYLADDPCCYSQTYSGIVLVAVNPFAAVPLYEPNLVQAYAGKKKGDVCQLLPESNSRH